MADAGEQAGARGDGAGPPGRSGGEAASARAFLPDRLSLAGLRRAADGCRGCHLYERATQTVFGEGLVRSRLMLVGEMPGDREDVDGRPFVGPAGRILDEVLEEAGIGRDDAYVTNVVKHFKWEPRGGRRLHRTPNRSEISACIPWLEAEIEVIEPEVVVTLGATASKALLGSGFRVTRQRGRLMASDVGPPVAATVHPAAVLRRPDAEERRAERRRMVEDLRTVARHLADGGA